MGQAEHIDGEKKALKTATVKSMDIQTPTDHIDRHFRNQQIKAQARKWDAEGYFSEFEQALDTLDMISDALPDDPKVSNALIGLHGCFRKLYEASKPRLLVE